MAKLNEEESRAFYQNSLNDQRHLLRTAIKRMGDGDLVQALTVATAIRVFVHETGNSTPLLKRLHPSYLELPIVDERPRRPGNELRPAGTRAFYLPISVKMSTSEPYISLLTGITEAGRQTVPLGNWWISPLAILPAIGDVSRRELILAMANKEAAHVDTDITEKYRVLLESPFLSTIINGVNPGPLNITRLLAGRAGVQLLDCLDRNFPEP